MAGFILNLLLLTLHYVILDCTKRTLALEIKPYDPHICRELCEDLGGTFYSVLCHRFHASESEDSLKDSVQRCLMEERGMNQAAAVSLQRGLDICNNHYEGAALGDLHPGNANLTISLHQACEKGRLCTVKFILSRSPDDVNTRDKLGRTPAMVAVMKHQVMVFDFLVSQSCDLMAVDNNNDTVLHVACNVGDVDIVRKLVVNHTCDIESRGGKGMTPVMKSALHGHRDVFDLLVSKGCNVKTLDDYMNNILHVACSGGHVDMVKYVFRKLHLDIESKGEQGLDSRGQNGQTPVMIAASKGHLRVVKYLMSKGCDVMTVDDAGDNLLHVTSRGGHVDIAKYVLSQTNISVDSRGLFERTPVQVAAYSGHKSMCIFLVKQGCNPRLLNTNSGTVIHMACLGGHIDVVKYVVEKLEIGIENGNNQGLTPVMIAAKMGHVSVVKYLMSTGCEVMTVDNVGNNLLHIACVGGNVDIVKYILAQTNMSIDIRGEMGQTAVMKAAYTGHMAVVKYLVGKRCTLTHDDKSERNVLQLACMGRHGDVVKYLMTIKSWSKTCDRYTTV